MAESYSDLFLIILRNLHAVLLTATLVYTPTNSVRGSPVSLRAIPSSSSRENIVPLPSTQLILYHKS
jgi:hypothetical protein